MESASIARAAPDELLFDPPVYVGVALKGTVDVASGTFSVGGEVLSALVAANGGCKPGRGHGGRGGVA